MTTEINQFNPRGYAVANKVELYKESSAAISKLFLNAQPPLHLQFNIYEEVSFAPYVKEITALNLEDHEREAVNLVFLSNVANELGGTNFQMDVQVPSSSSLTIDYSQISMRAYIQKVWEKDIDAGFAIARDETRIKKSADAVAEAFQKALATLPPDRLSASSQYKSIDFCFCIAENSPSHPAFADFTTEANKISVDSEDKLRFSHEFLRNVAKALAQNKPAIQGSYHLEVSMVSARMMNGKNNPTPASYLIIEYFQGAHANHRPSIKFAGELSLQFKNTLTDKTKILITQVNCPPQYF